MTGGGDCPGLNAAIRAVTRIATTHFGYEVIGIRNGFEGLITNETFPLGHREVRGILRVGGTILGSSNRTNPFRYTGPGWDEPESDASGEAYRNFRNLNADALIVIGGDGTLLLSGMFGEHYDIPMVGIPKTIDNDVQGSDYAIGFDSAVATVTDAVDKLHTTAESHHRVLLVEAMGRTAGWIALYAGVAGGADIVLIPERPYTLDGIIECIDRRRTRNHHFTIAVIAEGIAAPDGGAVYRTQDGAEHTWKLGGVASNLAEVLDLRLDQEVRSIVLGHLQRGGAPTSFDRILATQLGAKAIQTVVDGGRNVVVGMQGTKVVTTPLADVATGPRLVPDDHPMIEAGSQMGMYLG
jgi:ATP-dependent phosphofructokinase / diphosphate-dependent phosphofructokinase